MELLFVFLGSGIGGMLRHGIGRAALALLGPSFPYGTIAINIVGSFAMGVVAGWFTARGGADQRLRLFLTTGVIGGFGDDDCPFAMPASRDLQPSVR